MKLLCADCKKPRAKFDFVLSVGNPWEIKVTELCEPCLGKRLVGLVQNNFRFITTAWSRREDGYTKVVIEGAG